MQKPEIIAGIKNALSKGYSLEQAKKSFINSGYNPSDVEDSARSFSGVISNIPERIMPQLPPMPQPPQKIQQPAQQSQQPIPNKPLQQSSQPIQQTKQQPSQLFQSLQQQTQSSQLQYASQSNAQSNAQSNVQQLPQPQQPNQFLIQKNKPPLSVFWLIVTIILSVILLTLFGFLIMEIFFREKLIEILPFLEKFG